MIAPERSDVLVLGGGFGGVYCARRLERLLPRERTITLVSLDNYFVFQPLLPEVVGASLAAADVISPLRHLLKRTRTLRGQVSSITLAAGGEVAGQVTVTTPDGEDQITLEARQLVIALGSVVDLSRTPGMTEHALLMKNLADAMLLRFTLLERLERAMLERDDQQRRALLGFVVVGAGFSGIETVAEMNDLLRHALRFYPALDPRELTVTCVEASDRILAELDPKLAAFAQRKLARRGVRILTGTRVRAMSAETVYLESGETLAARTVVSTIGNAPHPMLQRLGIPCERGRLVVDEFLRVPGKANVFAVGDCAWAPDGHGGQCPPTAQFATRQATCCAENLEAAAAGRPLRRFRHVNQGQLASLGHQNAVAQILGLRISGILAWWIWRTIYLLKLPRFERKVRVVIDWTLRLFFPRDLGFLDPRPTRGLDRVHLEAGEVLFHQGDPSAAFYVVESGLIELSQQDAQGRPTLSERLGPGAHFGEGSLLRRRVRMTTAKAIDRSNVLAFRAREFEQLVGHFTGLRRLLVGTSRRFLPAAELLPKGVAREVLAAPVRALMASPVVTLPQDATLARGVAELTRRAFGSFPLVAEDGRLQGLVTRSDLYGAMQDDVDWQGPLLRLSPQRVHVVHPDDRVELALELMRRYGIKHLPVVDAERRVVGVVTLRDVMQRLLPGVAQAPA